MPNLDRFSQDITPAYPPEAYIPEYSPISEKEAEMMSMAQAAVKAIENARSAVDGLLNYININIKKDRLGVLVRNLRDLDQVPGEVEISDHDGGEDSPFSHRAEKEFAGVVFYTFLQPGEVDME